MIGAIIMQESAGNAMAYRYEPKSPYLFNQRDYAKKLRISEDTETNFQKVSWGLMQVMGVKARELGYNGHLPDMLKPSVGIEWGAKALLSFSNKYPNQEDVIASYNAGSPRRKDGQYVNQAYVDGVNGWLKKITA